MGPKSCPASPPGAPASVEATPPSVPQLPGVPEQTPPVHTSLVVHGLLSLHAVPSGALVVEHVPVLGSHVPAIWQDPLAVHVTGLLPVQMPPAHA
jgi:hypothetical protein